MRTTIGDFLLTRLQQAGVTEVMGVPGDFNLQLLEQIETADGIRFVGTTNELNAAYAADGYARRRGISALLTTYGVGELSALGGIAGAAAEHVPVVSIAGAPPLFATEDRFQLHHSLADGDFENMLDSIGQFTATAVRITPTNAVEEIDRALHTCIREKRPVHIQVPSDVSFLTVEVPVTAFDPGLPSSDPERLEAAVVRALELLDAAERPAILVDLDADRHGFAPALKRFAEKTGVPYAQMPTGKGILGESGRLFLGTYNGAASAPSVRARIENADFLITTTPRFVETNSGAFTQNLPDDAVLDVGDQHVRIHGENYLGITGIELLDVLAERAPEQRVEDTYSERDADPVSERDAARNAEPATAPWAARPDAPLSHERLWPRMAGFVRDGDVVIGESGTSNTGISAQPLPDGATYVSSSIWGAIGYTLPSLLGSMLAAGSRRHILFIGDGSFQLTGQELSTIVYHGLAPIIVLINNRGYTIERMILGMDRSYNDVADWQYGKLPSVFNPDTTMRSYAASTEGQLEDALAGIEATDAGAFLELHMGPQDAPAGLKEFGPTTADFDYGPRGPRNVS